MPLFALAVLSAMLPLSIGGTVRVWRNQSNLSGLRRAGWGTDRIRTLPACVAGGVGMVAAGWVMFLDPVRHGHRADAWQLLALLAVIEFAASFVVAVLVAMFNHPRWAVPPAMRSQPGWMQRRTTIE